MLSDWDEVEVHRFFIPKAEVEGFGFSFASTLVNAAQYHVVTEVDKGGSAEQFGLQRQDRLMKVNGVKVEAKNHEEAITLVLMTDPRQPLRLEIQRPGGESSSA